MPHSKRCTILLLACYIGIPLSMVRAIAIKQVNGPLFMLNGGEMENEFVGESGGEGLRSGNRTTVIPVPQEKCAKEKGVCKLKDLDYGSEFWRCHPTHQNGDFASDECKKCCQGLRCCHERSQTTEDKKVYVCKKRC